MSKSVNRTIRRRIFIGCRNLFKRTKGQSPNPICFQSRFQNHLLPIPFSYKFNKEYLLCKIVESKINKIVPEIDKQF